VKARISWNTTAVSQESRSVLGGHGYSALGNYSSFFHDIDISNTWEGDNHMLLQQTSKYLMRVIGKQEKSKIIDLSFIWKPYPIDEATIISNLRSIDTLETILKDLIIIRYANAKQTFENLSK
jgi:hypothetical protein